MAPHPLPALRKTQRGKAWVPWPLTGVASRDWSSSPLSTWGPHLRRPLGPRWAGGMGWWNHRRCPHPGEPRAPRSGHPGTRPACSAAGHPPARKCRRFGLSRRRQPRRRCPRQESKDERRFRSCGSRAGGTSGAGVGALTWFRSVYSDVTCSSSSRV